MLTLPILPDEIRIPLDKVESGGVVICEYPGVTAYARPLDVMEASRLNDGDFEGNSTRATTVVFRQLLRIDGLGMRDDATSAVVPFEVKNPKHLGSLPMGMRTGIFMALKARAELQEVTEKNSDLPSVSGGTSGTESSPAASAPSVSATS